jgi:predicted Fe-S protein YdhL (DUF1289 family)
MNETDVFYPCAGICRIDPESGYCVGCGRPTFTPPTSNSVLVTEKTKEEQPAVDLPKTSFTA